jgi:hypothetical protein
MKILILAVSLLCIAPLAKAQDKKAGSFLVITVQEDLSGRWEKGQKLTVYLRRNRNSVELIDLATMKKVTGKVTKTSTSEFIIFRGISFGTATVNLELARRRMEGKWKASFRSSLPDAPPELTVANVLSVWACSNHSNPTHTADSESEMHDLTDRNGCSGWHKLEPSDLN